MPKSYKCPREESCIVKGGHDSLCATGYQGPLCAVCSLGYYKQLKTCQLCPTKKWMIVQLSIIAAVAAIVFGVIIWTSKRKSKKKEGRSSVDIILCRLKIVIGFYQVTNGVLETFSFIKWPGALDIIGKYSEILQMNVFQVAPIHCLLPNVKMNAFGNLFAILGMNAAAILVAALAYKLRKLFLLRSTLNKEEKEKKVGQTKEVIYRNLFFFLFVTYLSTCSKTAQVVPLSCRKLCLDEEDKTCDEYLRADYSMNCNGQEYNRSVNVAYCSVFYILFLPTASLIVLWRQRRVLPGNVNNAEDEALENQEQATGNETRAEDEALGHQQQDTGNEIHSENEALDHQAQATGSEIQTENEVLGHQEQATGSEIQTENEALEHQEQATGSEIQTENEALDHQEQATGSEIQTDNEALDHQEQATGSEIQTENEALDHQEQATGSEIQTENEALGHQEQATGSEIQTENEALDHQEQATGSEIKTENEALDHQEQATGSEIQTENEALGHQEQATGSEIKTENEALDHQEQATGNEIQTENEALGHQEQATGSEIQTENEALGHQEQATGNEIQTENEALGHQQQATGSEIQTENEALDHQEQATGSEIQTENEALEHQEQATGSEIQTENEALGHQEQATGSEIQTENETLDHQEQASGNEIQAAENEALEPQEPATELVTGLRFLFENYNSRAWYWEFVEMFRKVILTSALIFLGGESRAYVGLAFLTSGAYAMLFACVSPMADPFENKLMVSSLSVTFVNLAIGAVSRIPQENSPSSIDPYLDSIIFNILVFGANTLVISLLVGNY